MFWIMFIHWHLWITLMEEDVKGERDRGSETRGCRKTAWKNFKSRIDKILNNGEFFLPSELFDCSFDTYSYLHLNKNHKNVMQNFHSVIQNLFLGTGLEVIILDSASKGRIRTTTTFRNILFYFLPFFLNKMTFWIIMREN